MKGYKHATAEQHAMVLELFRQMIPANQIASVAGIPRPTVWRILKKNGLKPRGEKDGACLRNAKLLREMAESGLSLSEMGRRISAKRLHVRTFLKLHNIPYAVHGQSYPGEKNPSWRGGRVIEKKRRKGKKQYVLIHMPTHPNANKHGYIREHRLVMEKVLGRYLDKKEFVHHKNGRTLDNRSENLEVYASNGEHLADELKGKCPKWSEEGKAKILAGIRRPRPQTRKANRVQTKADGSP